MLRMSQSLFNQPVLSLRTGTPIGAASEPIINPHNLKILGWWVKSTTSSGLSILLTDDVREIMPGGLAVDDDAAMSAPQDLVRHREILEIRFKLLGKTVKTKRQKLGKVSDFSYDDTGMMVQKLYIACSLVKVFTSEDTLIIDRSQILEVTDTYILVDEADIKAAAEEAVPAEAAMSSG